MCFVVGLLLFDLDNDLDKDIHLEKKSTCTYFFALRCVCIARNRCELQPHLYVPSISCLYRDSGSAGGAAEMSGPADGDAGPAAAGPPGLLQEEGGDRDRVLQEPGEAGRALHGEDA